MPGAALRPWVMEQGAICLSGRPSVRILQSYQCVSPANEKLAGTPAAALKMDDFPAQRRLPRTLGSTITLLLCLFSFLGLSATCEQSPLTIICDVSGPLDAGKY